MNQFEPSYNGSKGAIALGDRPTKKAGNKKNGAEVSPCREKVLTLQPL